MKTLTAVFLGSLIAAQADTVYLNGVGVTASHHWLSGESQMNTGDNFSDFSAVTLWAREGITSVSLQPFVHIYNADGVLLPEQDVQFIIVQDDALNYRLHGSAHTSLIQTETWRDAEGLPLDTPAAVTLGYSFGWDIGPATYEDYRASHLNEAQTWTYGFDVVSMEVVPEPPTLLMLAGGLAVFVWFKFKPRTP